MMMEGKDKPVDFLRVLEHIKAVSQYPKEDPCTPDEINEFADELCGQSLVGELYDSFVHKRELVKYQSQSKVIKVIL